jgi:hypothetical protein
MWVALPSDLKMELAKQQEVQFKGENNTRSKVYKLQPRLINSLEFELSEADQDFWI